MMYNTRFASDLGLGLSAKDFRNLGYQVIDLLATWLERESDNPVMEHMTGEALHDLLNEPLPFHGTDPELILDQYKDKIARYARRFGHPRHLAYVAAPASPIGILADALASGLNQNVNSWRCAPVATTVEKLVLRWLDEFVGFQGGGHGVLLSGGSAANFHGILCAITRVLERHPDARRETLTIYMSTEGHLSMLKAARILGIPVSQVRRLPVDECFRLRTDELRRHIKEDRERGLFPTAVCASAGTANTGAVDPLVELAAICFEEDLWFHIDGAYGAPASITEEYRWMRDAFQAADSLTLDPHKWLHAPIDVSCILMKDKELTRTVFSEDAAYLNVHETAPLETFAFFDHSMELSRRFRALKLWMMLKVHGGQTFANSIAKNIQLREHLDQQIHERPDLELLGSDLSITCFRYTAPNLSHEQLEQINKRIHESLASSGQFRLSCTRLNGRFSLRVCIVNFRTEWKDIDALVEHIVQAGAAELTLAAS